MSTRVSVLMTVRNGRPYIKDAIASVMNQTLREFELIVVDNGSTDGSLETVRTFSDPRIKILPLGRNIGRMHPIGSGVPLTILKTAGAPAHT